MRAAKSGFRPAKQGADGAHAGAALGAAAASGKDGGRTVHTVLPDGLMEVGFGQGVTDADIHSESSARLRRDAAVI